MTTISRNLSVSQQTDNHIDCLPFGIRIRRNREVTHITIVILLIVVAVWRIVATYSVFCQTHDEPAHICRGELWLRGLPYRHSLHPPLAPVVFAIGTTLSGATFTPTGDKWIDGNSILYSSNYKLTLTFARFGNLLFFVSAVAVLWMWCSEYFDQSCAVIAVLFFTMIPAILAHAGLATTDMSITAALSFSTWLFLRWLDQCTLARSFVLGVSLGITLICKLSAIVFLPACAIAVGASFRRLSIENTTGWKRILHLVFISLVALDVIWMAYRGSIGPVYSTAVPSGEDMMVVDQLVKQNAVARRLCELSVPAPEYWRGLTVLLEKNNQGHAPYFLGDVNQRGSIAFFPVILTVKTPIAFVVFCFLGAVMAIHHRTSSSAIVPFACMLAVMLVAMTSRINLGIRHILPLYPMFCMCAAVGFRGLWASGRTNSANDRGTNIVTWRRSVAIMLAISGIVESVCAHPDYLAYFNPLAGSRPDRIVVDSDLDWGQDLDRLATELRLRQVPDLHLAYFGTADKTKHGLPLFTVLQPNRRVKGYVAISITSLRTNEGFAWLRDEESISKIGKSILLYDVK